MKSTFLIIVALVIVLLFVSACAPGMNDHNKEKPAGFLWGIWHGWIAPISLIWKLFVPQVGIYEVNNSGWTYDFGFYIAIISGFGGLSLNRSRKKK
ncbi:MAG: hypothetical protein Q8M98_05975 [Candidatus Cloacimonadaceae bacterium]|nr:hypothetical protein [Candidatus Cloacimonadaceae bacterium]MDP3114311.1 hypothetical protein [Candidatus Cloacimonadaceae bacterium]